MYSFHNTLQMINLCVQETFVTHHILKRVCGNFLIAVGVAAIYRLGDQELRLRVSAR
jgi:hypothetical protein